MRFSTAEHLPSGEEDADLQRLVTASTTPLVLVRGVSERDVAVSEDDFRLDRKLELTALELTNVISPAEYGELYLAAHGYETRDSSALQQISPMSRVAFLRQHAQKKLLSDGRTAKAVAVAVDIGFLPNPARQTDGNIPTATVTGRNLEMLQLICQGATNVEIEEAFGKIRGGLTSNFFDLFKTLHARNRTQAVWRAFQTGVLRPSEPEMTLPQQYGDRIRLLETKLGGPIVPLPRLESRVGDEQARGNQRYEEFILKLLNSPDFAIYHPSLATYIQERYSYSTDQYRNLTYKLGEYSITKLQMYPGASVAHGIELNREGLLTDENQHRRFVTNRVRETYQRRSNGERAEPPKLDTAHLGFTLSDPEEAALAPVLRAAIGATHPVMEKTIFAGKGDLLKTLATFTGHTALELNSSVGALRQHGLIKFYGNDSHVSQKLTAKGRHLLKLGAADVKQAA